MFKNQLWRVIGVPTILNLDLPALHQEGEDLRKRIRRQSNLRTHEDAIQSESANAELHALVDHGKLLRMEDYIGAAGVTEKKLSKSLASGKVFSVELEGEAYIPGFFLSPTIPNNDFAKVLRSLGDTSDWNTWIFFTTPIEALGGSTPLQFLAINKVKPVLTAAKQFTKR
ncbi:hypothetical protein [Paraburkholderia sp. 40]|uniref:hypothetical protein n=1 Tax=Paraburkholderia sp. 40 TaxID=2991059 RepID=UPI003D2489ED